MYTLSFIKKSSPPPQPPPSKNRKIKMISDTPGFNNLTYTEINPAEYFNNAEYPFIYIDGDRSDYIFNISSAIDHGYYILYDKSKTSNERRFYTNIGYDNIPVDIRYSTDKWILTDGASQNVGIMEANTLEGPWNTGEGYGGVPEYAPTPTPIPLSSIEAMFKNDNPNFENSFLIFFKNTETTQNMYIFSFLKRNGAGFNDYNGLSIEPPYDFSSNVNINALTKENPIRITIDANDGIVWNETNIGVTITLVEE